MRRRPALAVLGTEDEESSEDSWVLRILVFESPFLQLTEGRVVGLHVSRVLPMVSAIPSTVQSTGAPMPGEV